MTNLQRALKDCLHNISYKQQIDVEQVIEENPIVEETETPLTESEIRAQIERCRNLIEINEQKIRSKFNNVPARIIKENPFGSKLLRKIEESTTELHKYEQMLKDLTSGLKN